MNVLRGDHRPEARSTVGGRPALPLARGQVVAVYAPGDGPDVPDAIPCWLADVRLIEPGWQGVLKWVPILTQSGGTEDIEHWRLKAAETKVNGGSLKLEGGPDATPPAQADGDIVVVGFLGGDNRRPVILGQLAHPQTKHPAESDYRYLRFVGGTRFGVDDGGNVEIEVPEGVAVTVRTKAGDGATIEITDTSIVATGAKLTVKATDASPNVQPVLLDALMGDAATVLLEWYPIMQVAGVIFGFPLTNTPAILPLIAAGGPALNGRPYKAASTESD